MRLPAFVQVEPSEEGKQERKVKETNRLRKRSRSVYWKEMLREIARVKLSDTRKTIRGGLVCRNTHKHFHLVLHTQTPRVTLQLCPDDSNNSPMESCGWRRLREVTESVFCLQKGVSVLFVGIMEAKSNSNY